MGTHEVKYLANLISVTNVVCVISALGDTARKASHVPYRDSKLTRLLQVSQHFQNSFKIFIFSD